jgi:hypothetical protein
VERKILPFPGEPEHLLTLHFASESTHPCCERQSIPRSRRLYFNRVENGSIHWVSYQETQEQKLFPHHNLEAYLDSYIGTWRLKS